MNVLVRPALLALAIGAAGCAPMAPPATATPTDPAPGVIATADLRQRLEILAHDSMMGREAGTIYNDKATDYIAAEAARIGLQPAGENGTYFQRLPIAQRAFAAGTQLSVAGRTYTLWQDFLPRDQGPGMRQIAGVPTIFGGSWADGPAGLIPPAAAAGRVMVVRVVNGWIADRAFLSDRYRDAAGIIVATLDRMPAEVRGTLSEPSVAMVGTNGWPDAPAFLYVTDALAEAMFGRPLAQLAPGAEGQAVTGRLEIAQEDVPGARNVVAVIPGSDPALRGQYVVLGAHNDHIGFSRDPVDHDSLRAFNRVVRPRGADDRPRQPTPAESVRIRQILDSLRAIRPPRPDSIYNGADDNGSGTVALMAIAEAVMRGDARPRRSLLFVWHTAEEAGLVGARYYTDNPTVPRDSMIAMFNLDMVGRGTATDLPQGGPGYLQAIGTRRHSTEFGQLVDAMAAMMSPRMNLDYQYDAAGHPDQYYCRSDHYMYARYGIPVAFFSTGSHPDYHQVTDEVQYISFEKLAHVSSYVFRMVAQLANADRRPMIDQAVPPPGAPCVQ